MLSSFAHGHGVTRATESCYGGLSAWPVDSARTMRSCSFGHEEEGRARGKKVAHLPDYTVVTIVTASRRVRISC